MSKATPTRSPATGPPAMASLGGVLIGPAFLVLAAFMWLGSRDTTTPAAPTPLFDRTALTPGAFRTIMDEPPVVMIGGYAQRCNDCHQLFASRMDSTRPLAQHRHIKLNHGINDECANCHARQDRDRLILRGGEQIAFTEAARLCQQCHGPVYRDWTRGAHGKTMGSWVTGSPEQHRLICTECHDPHAPTFAPLAPLPGPNTLRMGESAPRTHDAEERNPLRRWLVPEHEEPAQHDEPAQDGAHPPTPQEEHH